MGPRITRQILREQVEDFFQKKVEVGRAGITIFGGFGIQYKDVRIPGPNGKEFFRVKTFILQPWIKSLMMGRLKWKRIVLKDPSIHLIRTAEGQINLDWKRKEKAETKPRGFFQQLVTMADHLPSQLSIRGGRIRFVDFGLSRNPLVTEMEDIEVTCQDISPEKPFSISLTGRFGGGRGEKFSISGKVMGMDDPPDPNQLEYAISLRADDIDSRRIWPYARAALPFEKMRGLLDLKIDYRGGRKSFRSSGEMKIRLGQFAIPALYRAAIKPKEVSLTYDLEYEKEEIHISQLVFRVPHVSVRGSGLVQKIYGTDRSISLDFATGRTSLKAIRPYLPDRVIPKGLLAFLTDRRTEGFLRVEKARLEGPWANLTTKGVRKNPKMLLIRTRLDAWSLLVDSKIPPVRNISGLLTLRGDQVSISDFRGQLLRSHLVELNGSVSRIYSDPRIAVTFKGDLDLKGLLPLLKANRMPKKVRKAFDPILKISGKAKIAGEIRHRFSRFTSLTYKTRISLRRVHVKMASFALPLTHMEGEIQCDEKEILLSHFKWRMGESLCHGRASFGGYLRRFRRKIILSNRLKISLDMGAEKVRIDNLFAKDGGKRKTQIDPESIWVNSTIEGKVRISKGSLKEIQFENFGTVFTIKRGLLRFKKFQAEAPGGFVRFKGWINMKSAQGISFKLIPIIHQLDMTNAIPIPSARGKGRFISGTLNLEGIMVGNGSSADNIIESLQGDLQLRAENGRMYGLKTHTEDGLPYNHMTGQIVIQRGVASTGNLYLDSDAISMAIKGRADLKNQRLYLNIGVRPLQTMDKVLSNVPVVGWILAGKDRSILTFSYRVRGKFNDLKVESGATQSDKPAGR